MSLTKLKDYNTADTITAIATFPSAAALGVIKISGKHAIRIAAKIFIPRGKKNIQNVKTYTLHYGWIITQSAKSKAHGVNIIDEVLVSVMRAPNSYTREDVVEISCHGGVLVLNKILNLILRLGARLAYPGEFTYRAFINGRIDLLKAQSILSIVDAKSEASLALAGAQLKGKASAKIEEIKNLFKEIFVETEALINFPDDGVKPSAYGRGTSKQRCGGILHRPPKADWCGIKIDSLKIRKRLITLSHKLDLLLEGSQEARLLREGLRCVVCGKTNVGKSTLFNCLFGEERVIVSKLPGTTRDVIEETINIRGIPLRIYDTAGIFEPKDLVARKAIKKTAQAFEEADLIILVLDGSRPLSKDDLLLFQKINNSIPKPEDHGLRPWVNGSSGRRPTGAYLENGDHGHARGAPVSNKTTSGKSVLTVINKSDLKQKLSLKKITAMGGYKVKLSALKKKGIKNLEQAIFNIVYKEGINKEDMVFLAQSQTQALKKVRQSLYDAVRFLEDGYTLDFVNLSLKEGLDNLARLSGEILSEDIIEDIFSNFCIGK